MARRKTQQHGGKPASEAGNERGGGRAAARDRSRASNTGSSRATGTPSADTRTGPVAGKGPAGKGPTAVKDQYTRGAPSNRSGPNRAPSDPNLLFGRHSVRAALLNADRRFRAIWCLPEHAADLKTMMEERPSEGIPLPEPEIRNRLELDTLLPEGSVHQGIAARVEPLTEVSIEEILMQTTDDPHALLVVLDQVTDPHNVGAILRSTAAFGAAALIMQDRHGPPITGVLAKTASGALDVVPVVRVTNLSRALDAMKAAGFWCVGLAEQTDTPLATADLSGRTALVLGAEGDGLRRLTRETCDLLVKLPTVDPIGSLNVSAAAAVALYQARVARESGHGS